MNIIGVSIGNVAKIACAHNSTLMSVWFQAISKTKKIDEHSDPLETSVETFIIAIFSKA